MFLSSSKQRNRSHKKQKLESINNNNKLKDILIT